jgi:hypothetical protein
MATDRGPKTGTKSDPPAEQHFGVRSGDKKKPPPAWVLPVIVVALILLGVIGYFSYQARSTVPEQPAPVRGGDEQVDNPGS